MTMARVRGSVVAAQGSDGVAHPRFLLVEECDERGAARGEWLVALDLVGADRGQLVLLTQGSSCRWTYETDDKPMDALIVAIVDSMDSGGVEVWKQERSQHG